MSLFSLVLVPCCGFHLCFCVSSLWLLLLLLCC